MGLARPLLVASLASAACACTNASASSPSLLSPSPTSASRVVFLDFSDGTHGVTLGEEDDATHDVSQLCGTTTLGRWEAPRACAGGDRVACREEVLLAVRRHFEPYDVDFTLTRPAAPAVYTTIVIAPTSAECTFGQRGVAAADCDDANPASLGMVFDCHGDAASCAVLVAHEAGHTFGLVHSRDPLDVMTPGPEDPQLTFLATSSATSANTCGISQQSSHATLLRNLGPRWRIDPS